MRYKQFMESEAVIEGEVRSTPVIVAGKVALSSQIFCELAPHELLILVFGLVFDTVAIIAAGRVTQWPNILLQTMISAVIIGGMCYWAVVAGKAAPWPRRLRIVYLFPLIWWYFRIAGMISFPLHGHDFDNLLIAADRLIFGVNPTWWLFTHFPKWPALTEYLMVCYSMFYFLPCAVALELYLRARHDGIRSKRQLDQVVFVIVYGFLLSYVCYFFLPAIGPRFTLHDFASLSKDLPGLWLTEPLRAIVNGGEGILPGMPMAEILRHVTRDAFPSGHTDMTLLTIVLAFQLRARVRWLVLAIGASLIFATVYLRFHYVIDLFGGAVLALITLYSWQWVRERMISLQRIAIR